MPSPSFSAKGGLCERRWKYCRNWAIGDTAPETLTSGWYAELGQGVRAFPATTRITLSPPRQGRSVSRRHVEYEGVTPPAASESAEPSLRQHQHPIGHVVASGTVGVDACLAQKDG